MNLEKMGKFISELRKEKQLTQTELGDLVGVENKVISKWEKGTNAPDTLMLIKLSNIFSVRVEEIVNGNRIEKYQKILNNEENIIKDELLKSKEKHIKRINMIIFVLIVLLFISVPLLIYTNVKSRRELLNDETITVDLINDSSTPLNVNGCIMYSSSSNLYVIKGVSYESKNGDKSGEALITDYEVKLLVNNKMIATYTQRFDSQKRLDDAIDNLAFSVESGKRFSKDSSIKLQIKYTTIGNDKKVTETDLGI